ARLPCVPHDAREMHAMEMGQEERGDYFAELLRDINSPWIPPEALTIDALKPFANQSRIWLADIIKMMTGLPDNSAEPSPLGVGSHWRICENAAQRQQAAKTLFNAARKANR